MEIEINEGGISIRSRSLRREKSVLVEDDKADASYDLGKRVAKIQKRRLPR